MAESSSSSKTDCSGPNLSLNVQRLIQLLVVLTPKQLTLKGRLRGRGGSPSGSSLPRHGARVRTRLKRTKRKRPRADYKLAQEKYRNNNLYDA